MSVILGLNCYHTDTAACIVQNGKLEFAIEEERLNRKNIHQIYPYYQFKNA